MVSFILFDEDEKMREELSLELKRFLFEKKDCYRVVELGHSDKELLRDTEKFGGTKIYILNIDTPYGLSIARRVREAGDFNSPVILYTRSDKKKFIDKVNNILFLELIKVDGDFSSNFWRSLVEAYKIVTKHMVYSFSIYDEVYRIPYNDIYFIIKNYRDDSVTIYTKDDSYITYTTVKELGEIIGGDVRFFKTHRSCIVNLHNVLSYDRKNNIVVFKNGMTTRLVSRNNRSLLVERLKCFEVAV